MKRLCLTKFHRKTIKAAMAAPAARDTINVLAGTYTL